MTWWVWSSFSHTKQSCGNKTMYYLWSLEPVHYVLIDLYVIHTALYSSPGSSLDTMGAFYSTKTSSNLETAPNGTEFSQKSFQKFQKLLNFWNANHSTKDSRNYGSKLLNGKKTYEKKLLKICKYLARLSSFLKILENAVPFANNWKLPKIQTRCFGWMESDLHVNMSCMDNYESIWKVPFYSYEIFSNKGYT